MYTIEQRIKVLQGIFNMLQETSSRIEKEAIIAAVPEEILDDFIAILEVLDNRIIFGYTMTKRLHVSRNGEFKTIREIIEYLAEPKRQNDLSEYNIFVHLMVVEQWYDFFEPIVNKTLRLGIGRSILTTDIKAPMLAKRFGDVVPVGDLYITEKLDGNRCYSYYGQDNKWHYYSRNGRPLNVEFDMTGLSPQFVYDGEILSEEQTFASVQRYADIQAHVIRKSDGSSVMFQTTSGLINRKYEKNKGLTYNIFDIQAEISYTRRRYILDTMNPEGINVRIVPIIAFVKGNSTWDERYETCCDLLDRITDNGGEGLMLNVANAIYEHKRTKNLLKFKKSKTMDMIVESIYYGTGKYENAVGGLMCSAYDIGGITYACSVGSGLSDEQRNRWIQHPEEIIGKVVEVEYFELTQDKNNQGSKIYSLRFPRLKRLRTDKNTTSTN